MQEKTYNSYKWITYVKISIMTLLFCFVGTSMLVLIANPYRNLPFDNLNDRPMVEYNQRIMYPPLARDSQFDSAVFGTSTSRLLKPKTLNKLFGGQFAQLSMNSGMAYEQSRLFDLFIRHHPEAKNIFIGLDRVWCETDINYKKFTRRLFPEWMYDENKWNDLLYLFNIRAIKTSFLMIMNYFGGNFERYGDDGYKEFLPENKEYDEQKVLRNLYGADQPKPTQYWQFSQEELQKDLFPVHELMSDMLDKVSDNTHVTLFFVPYHAYLVFAETGKATAKRYQNCKSRIVELVEKRKNISVYDFMFPSEITLNDWNYWDPLHYRVEVADELAKLIHESKKGLLNESIKILKP